MDVEPPGYRSRNLTSAVTDKRSPLRQYLQVTYPEIRGVQRAFQDAAGPLLVAPRTATAGTVGTAFDVAVRFLLRPEHRPVMAWASPRWSPRERRELMTVALVARGAAADGCGDDGTGDDLIRACWALALGVETRRNPATFETGPLAAVRHAGEFTTVRLLGLADDEALQELRELLDLARERLLPHLVDDVLLGPTFDASQRCPADADLICGTTLVELKTRLGGTRSTGERYETLTREDLYQVLAYALFDTSDQFALTAVALYSGRYGTYGSWTLAALLADVAGRPVEIAAERRAVWNLLGRGGRQSGLDEES